MQHGGDTSAPLLDRVREQTRTHDVPKGCDPQVQFLVDPRVDRVPVQPSLRMRLHAVLEEAEEGQGAHRGDRDGRRADHHRPLIAFNYSIKTIIISRRQSRENIFLIGSNIIQKTRIARDRFQETRLERFTSMIEAREKKKGRNAFLCAH